MTPFPRTSPPATPSSAGAASARTSASPSAGPAPSSRRPGRVFNFSAGPGMMPEEVLRQIQEEVWDCRYSGIGILEHSHRAPTFDAILTEVEQDFREVGQISPQYRVLFMTGGSTSQNYLVPMNLLPGDRMGAADYFDTGYWAHQSIEHAKLFGTINTCASSRGEGYTYIPTPEQTRYSASPAYIHYTSNNTIYGIQHHSVPEVPTGVPLVCDMCSDIFSCPLDVSRHGLIYASAQKNLGPAGVTVVIARDDVIERGRTDIPGMLQYRTFAKAESRPNTPPVFPIYCVGLMVKWIKARGGLDYFERYNAEKAKILYDVLDSSAFYRAHARADSRSLMNVTFKCPTPQLDDRFATQAEAQGLDCLRGHRATGGMRASIYNAMPREGCVALAAFMREFERTNG